MSPEDSNLSPLDYTASTLASIADRVTRYAGQTAALAMSGVLDVVTNPLIHGLVLHGQQGYGARITRETLCTKCEKPFAAGDNVRVRLAKNFAHTTFEHEGTCP